MPLEPNPKIGPRTLVRERLQLHHATRLLASAAEAFCRTAHDDSHSNLGLDAEGTALTTHPLDDHGRALTLELGPLELVWSLRGMERARFGLVEQTMATAFEWLNASKPHAAPAITPRAFPDFPSHTLAADGAFVVGDPGRRVQLGRYFALARHVLDAKAAETRSASPRRVWPHHFDLGTLIPLPGSSANVGLGLSPGDSHYEEPYLYVSRYPSINPPPGWNGLGHWHTDGFTSLVMTATEWQAIGGSQVEVVSRFVEQAFAAAGAS